MYIVHVHIYFKLTYAQQPFIILQRGREKAESEWMRNPVLCVSKRKQMEGLGEMWHVTRRIMWNYEMIQFTTYCIWQVVEGCVTWGWRCRSTWDAGETCVCAVSMTWRMMHSMPSSGTRVNRSFTDSSQKRYTNFLGINIYYIYHVLHFTQYPIY